MKFILKGDLFQNVENIRQQDLNKEIPIKDYIVHGCNAQGKMGSGFAKVVKEKYPQAYEDYLDSYKEDGLLLGCTYSTCVEEDLYVVNAITQEFYGRSKGRYVDYYLIESCFRELVKEFEFDKVFGYSVRVHYPKIGAGLAGGDWNIIEVIIDKTLNGSCDQYLHLG